MSVKEILTIPNNEKFLREKSENITSFDSATAQIISDLIDTLKNSERPGVGLAAPQIGYNKRIVVIESEGHERENGEISDIIPRKILVNPRIVKYSKEKTEMSEGCLSVPDLLGDVTRPKKVKVEALDENGEKICINASGFLARVLQHEIDHLDGILFIDLISNKSKFHKIVYEDTEQ